MTARRHVVLDTDVLLALAKSGELLMLRRLVAFEFHVTDVNAAEVRSPVARAAYDAAVAAGALHETPLVDLTGLVLFGRLLRRVDKGEAAAAAQAAVMGAALAMHDAKGRKAAARELPTLRLHVLEDIVVEAVRAGALDLAAAEAARARLVAQKDYPLPHATQGLEALVRNPAYGLAARAPGEKAAAPGQRP